MGLNDSMSALLNSPVGTGLMDRSQVNSIQSEQSLRSDVTFLLQYSHWPQPGKHHPERVARHVTVRYKNDLSDSLIFSAKSRSAAGTFSTMTDRGLLQNSI